LANGQASDAMQVDDKENMNSTEATLDEIFAVASPPPSVSVKKNPVFRGLHTSSHSMDVSSQSSESEIDSPLCMSRFTSRFRPKPKVRRTLSMFQKPGDLLDTEMEDTNNYSPLQLPCQKPDECQILPCFGVRDDMLKRIEPKTVHLLF
jgi:M-phase inducer tyrosine phosphatase